MLDESSISRMDLLELGGVAPLPQLDPDLGTALAGMAASDVQALLRCTDPRGLAAHREAGARWAARYGLRAEARDVVICAGAQHALYCCLAALSRPGHHIAVDALTYPGMIDLAAGFGLHLVPVPMDAQGMVPERLDALCRNHTIHGLYLMPGVHNPTAARMSAERREALATLARRHDLLILEDDAYALTDPDHGAPVASFARERTFFIAGLTKTLAPGLRIAFLVLPPDRGKGVVRALADSLRMVPPLTAAVAARWIDDGTADRVLAAKRAEAAQRNAMAGDILRGCTVQGQTSNFFLWLFLPQPWTPMRFEAAAGERGVHVLGAHRFAPNPASAPRAVRLSLTAEVDPERVRRGLGIVARLVRNGE